MSTVWFTSEQISPNKNYINKLVALLTSHGFSIRAFNPTRVILYNGSYKLLIYFDSLCTTIKKIIIIFDDLYSKTFTWIKGFTMQDHSNVPVLLKSCDEYVQKKGNLTKIMIRNFALAE